MNKELPDIVNGIKKSGVDVAMSSNGALFTREKASDCLAAFTWIRFSVASMEENSYNAIQRGKAGNLERVKTNLSDVVKIKRDKKLKTTLGVQCLLLPDNMDQFPEARGSGYHMAILRNWGYWGVTAHFMDEQFDTGPIIECRRFPISDNCINKDLVRMAHENAFLLFRDTVEKILSGNELETMPQQEGNYYSLPELEKCKDIGENESIEDIDRKIRAFWNPPYSGAKIEIKGKKYTVINEEILHWIDEKLKNNSQNGGDIDEKLHTIQQFEDFPSYGKY